MDRKRGQVTYTLFHVKFNHFEIQYDNNVHFDGVRLICGPHLVIVGLSETRADLMAR